MEKDIFSRPAVVGILSAGYVESRLHMDWQDNVAPELAALHRKIQKEFAESVAMPIYVIVNPKTGQRLGRFTLNDAGSASKDAWEAAFIAFLKKYASS